MKNSDAFIEINGLNFRYTNQKVLSNVTISVPENQFLTLIGPNGGGKSTFLKIIMGLIEPAKGSVLIDGKPPKDFRPSIGYVPQNLQFDPQFPISVEEFVLMGCLRDLTWFGAYPMSARKQVDKYLDVVDMISYKNRPLSMLSGGQRQRVAIARALMGDPKLLLLDEPTSGLDAKSEAAITKVLKHYRGKKTILLVTHSIDNLLDISDRVLCVSQQCTDLAKGDVCQHLSKGIYLPEEEKPHGH